MKKIVDRLFRRGTARAEAEAAAARQQDLWNAVQAVNATVIGKGNEIAGLGQSLDAAQSQITSLAGQLRDLEEDTEGTIGQLLSVLSERDDFIPPPPKHLQKRVVGGYSPLFLESGYTLAGNLQDILAGIGRNLAASGRVLEWGCGCGRSLRAIKRLHPHLQLFGTDIDNEAIGWLQRNYSLIAEFAPNGPRPPIPHDDHSFDLIYAVSVFTHLPEDMQFEWLQDLARLLKPDGVALVSFHGEVHHARQGAEAQEQLRTRGFYYDTAAHLTDGLPDFYLNTYHTNAYIEREWSRFFDVRGFVPLGFEGHQDVVILAPKA